MIIGRRAPDPKFPDRASEEAYYNEGTDANVPEHLSGITSIRVAIERLGKILGLPQGTFRLGLDDLVVGRVTVPELLPLILQPQSIIATETLFASDDVDRKSRARFREIVDIALGIVTDDLLVLRGREEQAEARRTKALAARSQALRQERLTRAQLAQLWQEAASLGIAPGGPASSTMELRSRLEQIEKAIPEASAPIIRDGTSRADDEARAAELRKDIQRVSAELDRIKNIRAQASRANAALSGESERLRVIDVLGSPLDGDVHCPLCDSVITATTDELIEKMRQSLADELSFVQELDPGFEEAEQQLVRRGKDLGKELTSVESRLRAAPHIVAPNLTVERINRERLLGAIINQLRWTPVVDDTARSTAELEIAEAELSEIKLAAQAINVEAAEANTLRRLSDRMTEMANELGRADLRGGKLAFDPAFSTVERVRGNLREPLDVIGGAENYVMYHLCALLALHAEFLSPDTPTSIVPPLLILDQPSQTYFPSTADKQGIDNNAVRKMYDLLFRFAEEHEGKFQILALDHADYSDEDPRFERARKYDWYEGNGLIPE